MNTLEILYQAFRVRYSLNQLQQLLDRGCRIALLGPGDAPAILKGYFGEPIIPLEGGDPAEDLVELDFDLNEEDIRELKTCDACLVLFPEGPPEIDELRELAEKIPLQAKTLWMCLVDEPKTGAFHENELTLPTVQALPRATARESFLKLLMVGLPQIVVILARHWVRVRRVFCKTLTKRTALRNGIRSGISALPLKSVPVVGPVLSLLVTSAETMILTSSQLRLSFVIAAAHNRSLDFFDRLSELWPIVGTAFGFRGASRTLLRRLPSFASGINATISFSGTYAIGEACRLYYEHGQPSSDEVRRELLRRSQEEGAREAQRLFRKVLAGQPIDEIEFDDDGEELLELVDGLTDRKKDHDEAHEAVEPTVEIPAVTDKKPESKVESKPEPKTESKTEDKPEPKTESKPEPDSKDEGRSDTEDSKKKRQKTTHKKKRSSTQSRSGDRSSRDQSDRSKERAKSKKKRRSRPKDGPKEKS